MSSIDADQVSGEVGASQPGGVVSARLASPVEQEGPLTDHLQFFADYENWSAGEPLPNRYPDNSGIQDFTDNNTVQAASDSNNSGVVLLGNDSGFYDSNNNESHSINTKIFDLSATTDLYFACWLNNENVSVGSTVFGHRLSFGASGWGLQKFNDTPRFWVAGNRAQSSKKINANTTYFIEGIWRSSSSVVKIRIDDSTTGTATSSVVNGSGDTGIAIAQDLGASVDQVVIEIAPQGELEWPSASTWLYNGGDGRSWNEIKTYQP